MATTTNYSWTTPDDSSLVKDGASAIRALGTAIDTSMNTALGTKKAGMVLLNTTSFSGVTSISLPAGTFSATYDNYRIIVCGSSAAGSTTLRFRTAGVDNSSASYQRQYLDATSTTVGGQRATNATSISSMELQTTANGSILAFDVFNPFLSQPTGLINVTNLLTTGIYVNLLSGAFSGSTSFDSLSIIQSSGNIAGVISAYGYNK
jgi:hypothetical protein